MNKNFPQYITKLRIDKSKELLNGTDLQVSEIAFKVGFESASYFNKVFKKITGKTPKDFRAP